MNTMTILYSCVAYKKKILTSHQEGYGSYENLILELLDRIPDDVDTKVTYTHNYNVHTLVDNEVVFICVSETDFGKRIPYSFLTKIKDSFNEQISRSLLLSADTHSLDVQFKTPLSQEMERCSSGQGDLQLGVLQNQVEDVRGIMSKNIEQILQRGERIEDLLDKTTDLESNAAAFQKTSERVKRKYWWKNLKMKIILGIVVFGIVVVIVVVILYSTGVFSSTPSSSVTTTTTTVPTTTK